MMKKAIATLITEDVKTKLEIIAEFRHKAHRINFNTSRKVYESILNTLSKNIYELNLPGIAPVNYNVSDLLMYFDEKDFDAFGSEKEKFNNVIEEFLKEVDAKFGTKYCPIGALRSDYNAIAVRRGQIYWVKREANALFSSNDEKHKFIPAIIISPDHWNQTHTNYTLLSITKYDQLSDDDYNIKFMLGGSEHIIRCFNPFSARRIHIGDYITEVDESLLLEIEDRVNTFFGFSAHCQQEEKLEDIIERIIREKSEKVRREFVSQSVENSMDIITKRLEQMYPNNSIEKPVKKECIKKKCEKAAVTQETVVEHSKETKRKKHEKWDVEKAKQFLDVYNATKDKKEVAKIYNFTSMSSLYTRKQRCVEMLGLA